MPFARVPVFNLQSILCGKYNTKHIRWHKWNISVTLKPYLRLPCLINTRNGNTFPKKKFFCPIFICGMKVTCNSVVPSVIVHVSLAEHV